MAFIMEAQTQCRERSRLKEIQEEKVSEDRWQPKKIMPFQECCEPHQPPGVHKPTAGKHSSRKNNRLDLKKKNYLTEAEI